LLLLVEERDADDDDDEGLVFRFVANDCDDNDDEVADNEDDAFVLVVFPRFDDEDDGEYDARVGEVALEEEWR
jgi:hypothetical protein